MSISRIVIEDYNVNACFIVFLILFKLINFHIVRAIRERFDFVSQKIFIEMKMWSNNYSKSKWVMQCFNLFVNWVIMKMRFMMLIVLRIFYVIEFFDKVKMKLRFCIMSNKSFVATCCVERNDSFKRNDEDWNFLTICDNHWIFQQWIAWSLTTWTNYFSTCMKWAMNCTSLCMRIIFVSSSISLTIILSTLRSIVKYSIFQFSMFIWSLM
jgi:hypothetical protein